MAIPAIGGYGLGITVPQVPGGIYGTGASQDTTGGQPGGANYLGMGLWMTVPTSWYIRWVDGMAYVSPSPDFSPIFGCKLNYDGALVFQCPAYTTLGLPRFTVG